MKIKTRLQKTILIFLLFFSIVANAQTPFGQMLTIHTYLQNMYGSPSWLLILRDDQSGSVVPYMYDFQSPYNHWLAFTYGHSARVTVSELTFGPFAKIYNFCGLENRILTGTTIYITITGVLSPDPNGLFCTIRSF